MFGIFVIHTFAIIMSLTSSLLQRLSYVPLYVYTYGNDIITVLPVLLFSIPIVFVLVIAWVAVKFGMSVD